ncbi:hypothetical protein ACPXCX_54995, partial [Streptomyces sp. DT225]
MTDRTVRWLRPGGRSDGTAAEGGSSMYGYGGNGRGLGRVQGEGSSLRDLSREHSLLPLRIFLGFTFVYAGLDKLTD